MYRKAQIWEFDPFCYLFIECISQNIKDRGYPLTGQSQNIIKDRGYPLTGQSQHNKR